MNVKLWQVILYPILVLLIVLGCLAIYNREQAMITNQVELGRRLNEAEAREQKLIQEINSYFTTFDGRIKGLEFAYSDLTEKTKSKK